MDLSFLIPSKVRRSVLAYFVENPEAKVYVRELARNLSLSPQTVHRELVNLEGWGFLFSSSQGNQRVFRVNQKFPLKPSIVDMFVRFKQHESIKLETVKTLDWKKLRSEYRKIPIPPSLIPGLTSKRTKPRAWDEEILLKKKSLI
ncbi:MAG: winged helix-turn-helix transcriptional regulator [Deltaproteobacteria bacterium]|nr:winged helix-turn-helix transcriptional regulator [Deltaproteobacteria bacterium]